MCCPHSTSGRKDLCSKMLGVVLRESCLCQPLWGSPYLKRNSSSNVHPLPRWPAPVTDHRAVISDQNLPKRLLEISAETTYQLNSSLCPISLPSFCFPSIGVDLNSTPHKHPIRESEWEVSFPGNSTQDQVCGICCSASHVDLTIIILHTGTRAHDTPKHSWAALTGIAE